MSAKKKELKMGPCDYSGDATPQGYVCQDCGAKGVRLFRLYQTFLNHQELRCTICTALHEKRDVKADHPYEIGWSVLAVPDPEGSTFWGLTSVPPEGVKWWTQLPMFRWDKGAAA